ncbi:MAG: hypothetical protein WDM70_00145 [Nitrosomonadales bacterium]
MLVLGHQCIGYPSGTGAAARKWSHHDSIRQVQRSNPDRFHQLVQFIAPVMLGLMNEGDLKIALDSIKEFINQGFVAGIENPLPNFMGCDQTGLL